MGMRNTAAERLDVAVKAVAPIYGVSIGLMEDKKTWEIQFTPEATEQQRANAAAILAAFDPAEPPSPAEAVANGGALIERQRAERKAHALSLLAQGKTEEAMKELLELI